MDKKNKTILLVEDEVLIAMAETKALKKDGYVIVNACDAAEAIEAVRANPGIDLILMDIDLGPGMDGTGAAEIILRERDIPVVFLSSHTEQAIVQRTEGITSYGYVVKNTGITVLNASIKMAFKLFEAHQTIHRQKKEIEAANEELVRSQDELEMGEARYRELFNNIPSGVAIYQAVNGGEDFIFRDFNRAGERIDDDRKEDLLGRSVLEVRPGIEEFGLLEVLRRVYRTGNPEHYPVRQYRDNRLTGWYDNYVYKLPTGEIVAVFNDVSERKLAEEHLRINEAMLRHILNTIPQSVFWKDRDSVYLGCNRAFAAAVGMTNPEDIAGKTDFDLPWPRAEAEAYRADDQFVITSNTPKYHIIEEALQADGSRILADTTKLPLLNADGSVYGVLGVYEDITERRRAELQREEALKALQDSEVRFRQIAETIKEVFWVGEPDWSVIHYISPAYEHIWGRPRESLYSDALSWQNAIHPDDRGAVCAVIEEYRSGGGDIAEFPEYRLVHDDGSMRWIHARAFPVRDAEGRIVRMVGIAEDITERKRADEALSEMMKTAADIVQTIPSGLFIYRFEPPDRLLLLSANPEAERLTGIHLEKWKNREFNELWPEARKQGITGHYLETVRTGITFETEELYYTDERLSGAFRIRAFVLPERRLAVAFENITERKIAEEKIKSLLAEKELLLRETHHRVKNNLASVVGLLELQAEEAGSREVAGALEEVRDRVQSMSLIYEKLYNAERFDQLSTGEYLPSLVEEIIGNFPRGESITIEKRIDDFPLSVKVLFPLGIIMYELVTNAMKYAFAGMSHGVITVTAVMRDDMAEIAVADNGVGIPVSVDCGEASGFGLRLVGLLVKQIRGTVRIERGNGTRFVIEMDMNR